MNAQQSELTRPGGEGEREGEGERPPAGATQPRPLSLTKPILSLTKTSLSRTEISLSLKRYAGAVEWSHHFFCTDCVFFFLLCVPINIQVSGR